jgi:carboxypeptidase N regulatory subunit
LNIESVYVEAAETMRFRPNLEDIDPSQNFHYVPNCEKFEYNISFVMPDEFKEVEIVPYEVYKMEKITADLRLRTISFYGWDNLKVLRIQGCEMDELYWEMFDGLSQLEHLSLEDNGIKEVPAFSFYGTPNIKTLSLAHNEILDMSYRSLAGLLELQLLDISDNNIGKLSEQTFPPFPKLEIVDLRQNPIRNLFPSIFGVMNKTEVLYIGADDVPLEFNSQKPFEHLNSLIYLEIPNLVVPKMDQHTFGSLSNLEVLKVRSGEIPFIEFDTFSKMLKLKELHLRRCKIEEISMDTFFGAKKLEIADLSHNKLKEVPPGLFDDQHDLTEIHLNDNQLTALPSDIFKLNSLKMIQLLNNPWDCNCEMKFWRQALTNKVRAGKIDNKCSGNALKHDKLNCDGSTIQTYTFDHKMTPKCKTPAFVNDKSVFYALRKVLDCSSLKLPENAVTEKPLKKIAIKQKFEKHIRDQKKKKQKEVERNSLHYQLFERRNYENIYDNNELSNDLS